MLSNNIGDRLGAWYENREPISLNIKILEYPCRQGVSKLNHQFKNWKQINHRGFEKEAISSIPKVGKRFNNPEDWKQGSSTLKVGKRFNNHKCWKKIQQPQRLEKYSTTTKVGRGFNNHKGRKKIQQPQRLEEDSMTIKVGRRISSTPKVRKRGYQP